MSKDLIPDSNFAIIGGSSTFSLNFPEDLNNDYANLEIKDSDMVFSTPYGETPPFKFFTIDGKSVLTVKMHGWRHGVPRGLASQQVFWVLQQAGVHQIIVEGGVGAINHLLRPKDLLVPSDYLDFTMRKDVGLGGQHLLIMRDPVCSEIKISLLQAIEENKPVDARVFDRGIYAVTDGRHFESRAEIAMLKNMGADIVGQSMCPEVYLAREIGACYARLDMVVNYAEGIVEDWKHDELKEIYYGEAMQIGKILLDTVSLTEPRKRCECVELRKETILK
ncbi:MAG: MTAP family purine nucleoside phosphorylase [Firmicutes bacterium]|nr:MTAP family purine nucleoside phosphorylase [Bacillota bacterium]